MGNFDGSNPTKTIDASVGGLVWVRRRNGSWWPGRIMGLEELSESFLVSPKSGTPVKLLGREDASIFCLLSTINICVPKGGLIVRDLRSPRYPLLEVRGSKPLIVKSLAASLDKPANECRCQHVVKQSSDSQLSKKEYYQYLWFRLAETSFSLWQGHMIDWYNLEKSKRVKAFRCGEYDEFIDKAKASAAIASKKAVRYARREDAILQALELESARLDKDQLAFSCRMDTSGIEHDIPTKNSTPMANASEVDLTKKMNYSEDRSDSVPELSQSGISFEENFSSSMARSGLCRKRTPNDSENDGTQGVKRMRGLEDLVADVVSKGKFRTGRIVELVREDSDVNCNLNTPNCLTSEHPPDDSKVSSSVVKRKRSLTNVNEFSKRKSRRRQLTKVLESTTMVSVPVVCNELPNSCDLSLGGFSNGKLSELESNESKKSSSTAMNNNSDSTVVSCENMTPTNALDASHFNIKMNNEASSVSNRAENDTSDQLFDEPFTWEGKNPAGFPPTFSPCSPRSCAVGASERQSSQISQAEPLCVSNELNNESGSISSAVADLESISKTIEKSSSKWQLKGKRNSRHTKKTRKNDSRTFILTDDKPKTCVEGTEHLDGLNVGSDQKNSSSIQEPAPLNNNSLAEPEKLAEDGLNELDPIKCTTSEDKLYTKMNPSPDYAWAAPRLLPFRQSRFMVHSKYQYHKSEFSFTKFGCNASLYDVDLDVKENYRPQHVPLVSLMSQLNRKAVVGHPLTVEVLNDGHCDDLLSRSELDPVESFHLVQSNSLNGKTLDKRRASAFRRFPSKKKSGQLSKKTRKLSSLTVQKQFVEDNRPVVEKSKDPLVVCIPLKVVFSRINEAINGLARPTHRPLTMTASQ